MLVGEFRELSISSMPKDRAVRWDRTWLFSKTRIISELLLTISRLKSQLEIILAKNIELIDNANFKSWEEENESLVGAKYWVGLFRSSDRIPFIPPGTINSPIIIQ